MVPAPLACNTGGAGQCCGERRYAVITVDGPLAEGFPQNPLDLLRRPRYAPAQLHGLAGERSSPAPPRYDAPQRDPPCQQNVSQRGQGELIGAAVNLVTMTLHLLWRHVCRRPKHARGARRDRPCVRVNRLAEKAGYSKVDDLGQASGSTDQDDIRRLDIAVDDSPGVCSFEGRGDLRNDPHGLPERQRVRGPARARRDLAPRGTPSPGMESGSRPPGRRAGARHWNAAPGPEFELLVRNVQERQHPPQSGI